MERQRQRRLLAELRLGSGRQRQVPDQCWRLIRELERKRAKVLLVQSRQVIHKSERATRCPQRVDVSKPFQCAVFWIEIGEPSFLLLLVIGEGKLVV